MLDAFQLRDLALAKKKEKALQVKSEEVAKLDSLALSKFITEMEELITSFAEEGHLDMFYKFTENEITPSMMKQIASEFKHKHPHFFVIENIGEKLLHIDWSGKHEV